MNVKKMVTEPKNHRAGDRDQAELGTAPTGPYFTQFPRRYFIWKTIGYVIQSSHLSQIALEFIIEILRRQENQAQARAALYRDLYGVRIPLHGAACVTLETDMPVRALYINFRKSTLCTPSQYTPEAIEEWWPPTVVHTCTQINSPWNFGSSWVYYIRLDLWPYAFIEIKSTHLMLFLYRTTEYLLSLFSMERWSLINYLQFLTSLNWTMNWANRCRDVIKVISFSHTQIRMVTKI